MYMAIFIAAVVVSLPLVGIVLVSLASKREDAAFSLGQPAQGMVQSAARRVLAFHSEDLDLPQPKHVQGLRVSRPTLASVSQLREDADDSPILVAASSLALSSAA